MIRTESENGPRVGRRATTSARLRIVVYLIFAFGIAWATAGVIYVTGGIMDSPPLFPGTSVTVAMALLGSTYMFAPAAANVLTRLLTREGSFDLRLKPRFGSTWHYWLAAWLVPLLATTVGAAIYFVVFPGHFGPMPVARFALQALPTVLVLPVLLSVLTFGEEFGWRGYLQPKLLSVTTNPRLVMVAMGIIWGAWHWPVIAMGYEYGFGYPGFPWVGMALFVLFTFSVGTLLGWLAFKSRSIWPAVLAHATINGTASLPAAFATGSPSDLIGPLPLGVVGGLGFTAVALWILHRWHSERVPVWRSGYTPAGEEALSTTPKRPR